MAVYLSPGVFPREIDLSVLPAAVGPLRPAFVGTANKGPINTPVFITSAQQALDTFGEPFPQSYLMYAVLAYLEEGNQCYIVRAAVEYEVGGDAELNQIAIATDGSKSYGWGRIPVFTGIDFGRIELAPINDANPLSFRSSSVSAVDYNQPDPRPTEGATDATLDITGAATYSDPIDDAFLMVITGAPTLSSMAMVDGATYQITRNSDGAVISSGELTEPSFNGLSQSISLGNGLSVVVNVSSGALNAGDTFSFAAVANNRKFSISVEGNSPVQYTMDVASYSGVNGVNNFVAAFNAKVTSEDYQAVAETVMINGVDTVIPVIQTKDAGQWLQITGTQGWALAVGTQQWVYNIPRAHLVAEDTGLFNINSTNNRVKLDVIGSSSTSTVEFNIPSGNLQTVEALKDVIDRAGIVNGAVLFDSIVLTTPGGLDHLAILTTTNNPQDTLVLKANYSNIKTLRFAQTLNFLYPYKGVFRGFSDTRVILPASGEITPDQPRSCELGVLSDCINDSAYYGNIVGFLVATSAGTWVDGLKVSIELFVDAINNPSNRYVITVSDGLGVAVEKFTDVVFDKTADRYVGNFLNPGTKYGGTTGAKYINWEERPAYLNNDPLDVANYVVRNPSSFSGKAFEGQQNGIPLDPAFSAAIDAAIIGQANENSGLYAFQNQESYDINLLLTPGICSGAVIATALQICEARGDVLYIVDPPFGLRPQQVVDWHNGMLLSDLGNAINSSYGALYWGWIKYYDQFNINEVWVPPSGHIAAVFSRTSRNTEQWYAPAGLTRGRLLTALELEYTPSQGENDLLYGSGNAVNPIVKFPQDGIVVWGNRTLQRIDTALSRVNVRMLLIFLKKTLTSTLRTFVFEPNDSALWAQVVSTINPFLGDIQSRRGLTAYKVVCDSSNNTPERIDRNELWVSVFLKPTRSVEFIVLNLAVVNTGANFSSEQVLAAGGIVATNPIA